MKRASRQWVLILVLWAAAGMGERAAAAQTAIEGTVELVPTKGRAAAVARYQQKSGQVAAPEKPVAVVYLEGNFKGLAAKTEPVRIRQQGYQFAPALVPVQVGTVVDFPNMDDDYHHVFSYSKVKEFDLGRYRKDEKPGSVIFDKAGFVRVGCEIHEHMEVIVLVLETPHFVKTDERGKYRLPLEGVPDGDYVLKAWTDPKSTVRERNVTVKAGQPLQIDFPAAAK